MSGSTSQSQGPDSGILSLLSICVVTGLGLKEP